MPVIALNWPQTRAMRAMAPGQTIVLPWGRGTGKSWYQRLMWWRLIAELDGKPRGDTGRTGIRIILLCPTRKQAIDIHAKELMSELNGQWSFLGGKVNHTIWRVDFPGGSWVQFFGGDTADAARGIRADVVSVDECDDVEHSDYDGVVAPWLSEPWSMKLRILSGTPRRGRYGLLYRMHEFATKGAPNMVSIHATYKDAPGNVDQNYVEQIRATTPTAIFEREWLCSFDAGEGLVYPMFDADFHIRRPDTGTRWNQILIGVDHGYEDPGVFVAIGVAGAGRDAVCHVLEEAYVRHQTEAWWLALAKQWAAKYPGAWWYADPSMPARIDALKRVVGPRCGGANNAIEDGVACVANLFFVRSLPDGQKYTRLYVDPSCANFIHELGLYRRRRDPKDRESVTDAIEDRNNHAMDAGRYACFSYFGLPDAPSRSLPQGLVA